ncbi:TonB-dependent receptor [Hyphomonas sp.]|uniref:TonB-dependent receptor plug domain-containing protein n=1 Tax=Hyphomonas sp. TaxID=87 RepID=UPI0025BB8096|nr:TonB-dependent receptor [Hyphomonas sp.]
MAKKFNNGFLFRTAAVTALATGFVFSAYAQTEDEAPVTTTPAAEGEAETGPDGRVLDTVRVTGSRLANPYTSIAPLDVISADTAALEGISDVSTLLQTATVAAGSPQVTSATSSAFVQNGGIGTETISLRGLGANRTLTLINGRRAGPAGTRGGVSAFDLNAIPLSAVSNIEILKDGASSIYGSDAVAGVVNIITKTDEGGEVDFFYSGPEQKGGEQLRASGTWSGAVTDRGNLLVSIDYTKEEELARGQRDYFECGEAYVFGADGQRADLVDPRTGSFRCDDLPWGHVWLYNYDNSPSLVGRPYQGRPQLLQYDYDGSLAANGLAPWGPNGFGLSLRPGWFPVALGELLLPGATNDPVYTPTARLSEALLNGDHPFQDDESLIPETERMTFFASGDYELTDSMQVYGEFLLNRRDTKVNGYRQFWQYDYAYNYFGYTFTNNPSVIANGFLAAPTAPGNFIGFSPTAITDHSDAAVRVDYVNGVVGAKGDFAVEGWNWDAFFQFSRSDGDYTQDLIYDDAITPYAWFRAGSCAALPVTPVRGVACRQPDWYSPQFLAGNISQADRDFLFGVDTGNTVYEQAQLEAFFDGPLFAMPAGDVIAGIGFSRIAERINDVPGETFQQGNAWGSSSAGITKGRKTTRAVFGELAIPLLKDQPFAEAVDLSLSARLTDVDVYGSDTTYKAGLGWQITPELRVRSTYGTSFRAPALFELFLDSQTSFAGQRTIDPCINWAGNLASGAISQRLADNCAADGIPGAYAGAGSSATIFESGNIGNLEAETSKAYNVGAVWSPSFADFRVSVDYFKIEIEDQITQLGAGNILLGCYNSDTFATEPLCDLFTRNPTLFLVNSVTNNFINIAEQTNEGVDVQAQYSRDFSFATLTMNTSHTFQLTDEIQLLPTSAPLDGNGEFGDPKWVGEVSATLERGPWSLFWGVDFIGKTSNIDSFGGNTGTYFGTPVRYKLKTEDTIYHNVSLSRELPFEITVRAGVSNVFDEAPPAVTTQNLGEYNTVGTSAFTSQYDWLGRRFFVNVNKKF